MGGTFDPVHYGHLVAAEGVRWELGLEKVIFVPAGHPPHKTDGRISAAHHRLAMAAAATASNPYFVVSDVEIRRSGPSFTFDTICALRRAYASEEIYFIVGADTVLEILTWHRVEELLGLCRFVAATRPGSDLDGLRDQLGCLPEHLVDRILPVTVPALAISSSGIRRRVRMGRPIKYLLPENVEEYIFAHRLYH